MKEIERDLARWTRGKWMAAIGVVLAVQIAALVSGSKPVRTRLVYPEETKVGFAEASAVERPGWMELENPFLFASASWDGFSAEAWLREPAWEAPAPLRRAPERFLGFTEARAIGGAAPGERSFALVERRRPRAAFPPPPELPAPELPKSKLRLEGFQGRKLAGAIGLPEQYQNDVLARSVVETLVGRDGLVITARLIENSGSPKADGDALALAKAARFTPAKNEAPAPVIGKLIFDWFALDLNHTNNVKR